MGKHIQAAGKLADFQTAKPLNGQFAWVVDRYANPVKRQPAQGGFTLIEIMVVVAIIAILGATVVPLIMDRPNEARVVRAKNDIASFSSALELYRLDNFNYPSTEQGLEALVTKPGGDPEPVIGVRMVMLRN